VEKTHLYDFGDLKNVLRVQPLKSASSSPKAGRLRGGSLRLGGQSEKEGGAFLRRGFDPNPAAMMFDDFFADG
jgi:hypothetical protein